MKDLLDTKLMIPVVRADLVNRMRLWQQLEACMDQNCRLLLISAPAGYGKTTLLAAWLKQVDCPVTWFTLEEGDNDLTRFLNYLVASLKRVQSDVGETVLSLLQSPQISSPAAIMTVLLNDLASIEHKFLLVLDDYHAVSAEPVHEAIRFLLDHQPPNMRIVIASRADPPLPLARLRARGQLVELRERDLRFAPDEATEFLNRVMGLKLAPEMVAALQSRTEGWAAGLQMAAVSLKGREDAQAFILGFTGSHRYVMDYLIEEVLRLQSQPIQEFLLRTSILERLSAALCDCLMDDGDGFSESQAILERLEQSNLFLHPLDENWDWFRYHRLFSDLLRQRLARTHPGLDVELHSRASRWYEQHGWPAEAIEHAFSAQDMQRALDLVDRNAESVMKRSETGTILTWGNRFPDDVIRTRPKLSVYHAYVMLLNGYPQKEIEQRLLAVEDGGLSTLRTLPLRAYFALFQGDYINGERDAMEALEKLPESDDFLRGLAAFVLGNSIIARGDTQSGKEVLERVAGLMKTADNPFMSAAVLITLAEVYFKQGLLHKAQSLYEKALARSLDSQGRKLPIAGKPLVRLGELMREWNQFDQALKYLEEGIILSGVFGQVGVISSDVTLAQIYWEQDNYSRAQKALDHARELAQAFDVTIIDDLFVEMYQAWLWLVQGKLDAAERWLQDRELDRDEIDYTLIEDNEQRFIHQRIHKYEMMVASRVLIQSGRPEKVVSRLGSLLIELEKTDRGKLVLEARMLQALALQAAGEEEQSLTVLGKVLEAASTEGYIRLFVDEGAAMRRLLRAVLPRLSDTVREYAASLLSIFAGLESSTAMTGKLQPPGSESLIEPLSRREMDILQLLESSLTTNEIADRLMVSVHTVRSHVKSIYAKLGVHGRIAAVTHARELKIL